jgi:hypothetical protein
MHWVWAVNPALLWYGCPRSRGFRDLGARGGAMLTGRCAASPLTPVSSSPLSDCPWRRPPLENRETWAGLSFVSFRSQVSQNRRDLGHPQRQGGDFHPLGRLTSLHLWPIHQRRMFPLKVPDAKKNTAAPICHFLPRNIAARIPIKAQVNTSRAIRSRTGTEYREYLPKNH